MPKGLDSEAQYDAMCISIDNELSRCGGWDRIFPLPENIVTYAPLFNYFRESNHVLARHIQVATTTAQPFALLPRPVSLFSLCGSHC